jgi:hypothetical protein
MTFDPHGGRLGPGDGFVIIDATQHLTGAYQALHGRGPDDTAGVISRTYTRSVG